MEISVHVCILDGTPPHESDCYRTLCEILGDRKASRWVDEVSVCLNHPPPEVQHATLGGSAKMDHRPPIRRDTKRDRVISAAIIGENVRNQTSTARIAP